MRKDGNCPDSSSEIDYLKKKQNKRLPVLASDGNNDKNNPTSNVEYFCPKNW